MRRLVAVLCVSVMVPSALACGASVSEEEAASSGEDSLRTLSASEILGNLAYGAESQVTYKRTPYYRAYRFTGAKGDQVVARVSSPSGHDAVAWLVRGDFSNIVYNDNAAAGTKDAEVRATLPADGTYYVVFREKNQKNATLKVKLDGTPAAPVDPGVPTSIADSEMSIVGVMQYGEQKGPFAYTDQYVDYTAVKFRAVSGDRLDFDLTGPDATTYLVGPGGKVLASASNPSLIKLRTTAPQTGDYRLVFHNTFFENQSYNVALNTDGAREGVDPFDPNSCAGAPMTNQDLVARLPSAAAAPGEKFQLGNHKVLVRSRSCAGGNCGAYSAPALAQPRTMGPTVLEREQDGSVSLSFRASGCYNSPEGAKCTIANDGTLTCPSYRYTYDRAAWNGNWCETDSIKYGAAPIAFTGTVKQHCARATATVRDNNGSEFQYVMLTQF